MAFVQTQTLEYPDCKDELAVLGRALTLLQQHDVEGAVKTLLARQDALMTSQRPLVKDYDPRVDLANASGLRS